MPNVRPMMTPPQIARRYGVSPDKVLTWIRTGELRAINVASKPDGRPRYVVDEADLMVFESRRQAQPRTITQSTGRKRRVTNVIEYF